MRKLKVFLSKSKNGDYDLGLKTKDLLLKAGMEVVEYTGGTYSPDLMLSCDVLIMVPAITSYSTNSAFDYVGKGQYSEISTWMNVKGTKDTIFLIEYTSASIYLKKIWSVKIIEGEEDWKLKYAQIQCYTSNISMNVDNIMFRANVNQTYLFKSDFYTDLQSSLADNFFSDLPTMPIQGTNNPCKEVIGRGECPDISLNTTQPIARPLHLATYKKLKR